MFASAVETESIGMAWNAKLLALKANTLTPPPINVYALLLSIGTAIVVFLAQMEKFGNPTPKVVSALSLSDGMDLLVRSYLNAMVEKCGMFIHTVVNALTINIKEETNV